jgi:hypothetical protein
VLVPGDHGLRTGLDAVAEAVREWIAGLAALRPPS